METISEGNDRILSDKERDQILHDLFEGKEGTLDSSFLYKGKGAELYENISKDKSYPFIDIEVSCLKDLRYNPKFKKILGKTKYITDVGSGDGQKAVALLGGTQWGGTYIPEDYSPEMLQIAAKNITEGAPRINLGSLNILTNGKHLASNLDNNMYLFLGGTICNMTDEEIISELRNMDNNGIINGNKILLSYFTAPKTQKEIYELIKIYNSESNRAFHENGMEMLGLSKEDFEFDTVYEKDDPSQTEGPFPGRIKGIIRAKRDCTVNLNNGKTISLNKGQEFTIHYSRRFTESQINELFKKSGCDAVFNIEENGDSIVLLKRKPMQLGKVKRITRNALIGLLILGSTTGLIAKNRQLENAIQKENAYTERHEKTQFANKGIHYAQETKELISALSLNELPKDNKQRQTIIDLFNVYVGNHKAEGLSHEELIQGFWDEYGGTLINNLDLKHSPYDFITQELIDNTKNFEKEIQSDDAFLKEYIRTHNYDIFEYNDSGEIYFILKVCIGADNTPIYLAAKKPTGNNATSGAAIPMSTNNVKEIKDKSKLDQQILSNNDNLESNLMTYNIDCFGHKWSNGPITLARDWIDFTSNTVHMVFVKGIPYYVTTGRTHSARNIGLASTNPKGPFTIGEFNKISGEISQAWNLQ